MNAVNTLINGGPGFIGSNLVHYQNLPGKKVTVFDLQPFPRSMLNWSPGVDLPERDFRNLGMVQRKFGGGWISRDERN